MIVGNSPAACLVLEHDLTGVFAIGVNRILRLFTPDALLLVDQTAYDREEGRITPFPGRLLLWQRLWERRRPAPVGTVETFELTSASRDRGWPRDFGDQLYRAGNTPGYALQLAMLARMSPIGMIGVDFNAPELRRAGRSSHFFGDGRSEGATGGANFSKAVAAFYEEALARAERGGIRLANLSPVTDSPFSEVGWPRDSLGSWLGRS